MHEMSTRWYAVCKERNSVSLGRCRWVWMKNDMAERQADRQGETLVVEVTPGTAGSLGGGLCSDQVGSAVGIETEQRRRFEF